MALCHVKIKNKKFAVNIGEFKVHHVLLLQLDQQWDTLPCRLYQTPDKQVAMSPEMTPIQ